MHELAHKLVALEMGSDLGSDAGTNAATQVIEQLRIIVARFSGSDSFTALIRRAVALTRITDPSLAGRTVTEDTIAFLNGLSKETTLTVIAYLLDLMNTFIGQALTLRLLADRWSWDEIQEG